LVLRLLVRRRRSQLWSGFFLSGNSAITKTSAATPNEINAGGTGLIQYSTISAKQATKLHSATGE
jgi:hypothetical protein